MTEAVQAVRVALRDGEAGCGGRLEQVSEGVAGGVAVDEPSELGVLPQVVLDASHGGCEPSLWAFLGQRQLWQPSPACNFFGGSGERRLSVLLLLQRTSIWMGWDGMGWGSVTHAVSCTVSNAVTHTVTAAVAGLAVGVAAPVALHLLPGRVPVQVAVHDVVVAVLAPQPGLQQLRERLHWPAQQRQSGLGDASVGEQPGAVADPADVQVGGVWSHAQHLRVGGHVVVQANPGHSGTSVGRTRP